MKVHNINTLEAAQKGAAPAEHTGAVTGRELVFHKTMTDMASDAYHQKLETLFSDINAQGEKLTKKADIKEFERYRGLIKEFMDEVVSNGYSFSKNGAFHSKGRSKVFATVNTVNKKLDEMAKELLDSQSNSINLLGKVDEIRGLIVDMML